MTERTTEAHTECSLAEMPEKSLADDEGWISWCRLRAEALERLHQQLLVSAPQHPGLVEYGIVERVQAASGTQAWSWAAPSEVQETINTINAWGTRLHDWRAWNAVVESYEREEDKWLILHDFVEATAFFCMYQPSAVSDRLMLLAERLMHQGNLAVVPGYLDQLDQDRRPYKFLRRSERRAQIIRQGQFWDRFHVFLEALDAVNSEEYRKISRNFRDLSSHAFAPRLMGGQIMRAARSIEPWQHMVAKLDGSYLLEKHPTKKCVSYSMRVVKPFPLREAFSANFSEYRKALAAMGALSGLIEEMCEAMDLKSADLLK